MHLRDASLEAGNLSVHRPDPFSRPRSQALHLLGVSRDLPGRSFSIRRSCKQAEHASWQVRLTCGVSIGAPDRDRLERLLWYAARPALALERLSKLSPLIKRGGGPNSGPPPRR